MVGKAASIAIVAGVAGIVAVFAMVAIVVTEQHKLDSAVVVVVPAVEAEEEAGFYNKQHTIQ